MPCLHGAGGADQRAVGVDDGLVEEGVAVVRPRRLRRVSWKMSCRMFDVVGREAAAEVARRGGVRDAAGAQGVEEDLIVASQFDVFEAGAVAQGVIKPVDFHGTAPPGLIIMTNEPLVSVLMPVYNAGRYVAQSVESILDQSLGDFEFLIVDDGSTDGSRAVLKHYAAHDRRIQLEARENRGLVVTLNAMLGRARGELIARMDADDVALPDRFALQVEYLRRHIECIAVGTLALLIDPDGEPLHVFHRLVNHEEIDRAHLMGWGCAIVHPSVVIRRGPPGCWGIPRGDVSGRGSRPLFEARGTGPPGQPAGGAP